MICLHVRSIEVAVDGGSRNTLKTDPHSLIGVTCQAYPLGLRPMIDSRNHLCKRRRI